MKKLGYFMSMLAILFIILPMSFRDNREKVKSYFSSTEQPLPQEVFIRPDDSNFLQPIPTECFLKETEPVIVPYEYGALDIHNERWRESFVYKAKPNHKVYEVTIPKRDLDSEARLLTFKLIIDDDITELEQDY